MTANTSPDQGKVVLNEQEARALNEFIAKKWINWRSSAEMFLTGDEVDELERKLGNV